MSGEPKIMELKLVRKSGGGGELTITQLSTPEMAAAVGLCRCETGFRVGGYAPAGQFTVLLNGDHSADSVQRTLAHELGHIFFGPGHAADRGDFLWHGVLDYDSRRVRDFDRRHFHSLYGRPD
jgi:hypothetical protein